MLAAAATTATAAVGAAGLVSTGTAVVGAAGAVGVAAVKFVGTKALTVATVDNVKGLITLVSTLANAHNVDDHELRPVLEELDLEAQLATVDALVRTVQAQPETTDVVAVTLRNVNDVLGRLKREIEQAHVMLETHRQRWFFNWRYSGVEPHLAQIRRLNELLGKRLDLLVKVLAIPVAPRQRSPKRLQRSNTAPQPLPLAPQPVMARMHHRRGSAPSAPPMPEVPRRKLKSDFLVAA